MRSLQIKYNLADYPGQTATVKILVHRSGHQINTIHITEEALLDLVDLLNKYNPAISASLEDPAHLRLVEEI